MEFSHKKIEKKWQIYWNNNKTFKTTINKYQKKIYILDMFPYPSSFGLHVGHLKGYTATDIISRMKKLQGFNVLHPIGWDAFGLPAEQYALQTGNNPLNFTLKNINNFRNQLKSLGFSYDYEKEINTSSPMYFKTTQWIFMQLYKQGLTEFKQVDVNWCEQLKTVLSNEEIIKINDKMVSERGHHLVIKKSMYQWIIKITKYAEKLLEGLEDLDWPKSLKLLQKNWIGESIGLEINFFVHNNNNNNNNNNNQIIKIFTTRADTIFGVEYLALSPQHYLIEKLTTKEKQKNVKQFIQFIQNLSNDQYSDNIEIYGIFIGRYAINPINNKKIPIWITNYVFSFYGTEAIMGVPAHNKKDYIFAIKYNLPITYVIDGKHFNNAYLKDGKHINSDFLNGLNINTAIKKVEEILIKKNQAILKKNYKLRDWIFSRQRYWGEPFPIIHWEDNTISLINENELPLKLPKIKNIKPSNTGESPLVHAKKWVNVINIENNKKGKRETNTMPQWAGSSWYYLAYILMSNNKMLNINSKKAKILFKKWLPVDIYIGGQEHAVLHLLYSRFWHKFLYDIKIVPTTEPFKKLINQGMILGYDGKKMSKSKGNMINPDLIIKSHGADTLRLYEMFMGPIESSLIWNSSGLNSIRQWLDRIFYLVKKNKFTKINDHILDFCYNNMVKKVTLMLENYRFNTAISELMIFINRCYKINNNIYLPYFENFVKILSCFAPHLSEEIWYILGHCSSITKEIWPIYDKKILILKKIVIILQINGKLRGKLEIFKKISKKKLLFLAQEQKNIQFYLKKFKLIKIIFVKNKIINFVMNM